MNIKFSGVKKEKVPKAESKESKSSCVLITETIGVESSRKGDAVVKRGRGRPAKNTTPDAKLKAGGGGQKSVGKKVKEEPEEGDDHEEDDGGDDKVWICPGCKLPDDGSPMIGCDNCDEWYHWPCVGIKTQPAEDAQWFCPRCQAKKKKSADKQKSSSGGQSSSSSSLTGKTNKKSSSAASSSSIKAAASSSPPVKGSPNKLPTMKAATKPSAASTTSTTKAPTKRLGRPPKTNQPAKRPRKESSSFTASTEEEDDDDDDETSSAASTASSTPLALTPCLPRKTARKSTSKGPTTKKKQSKTKLKGSPGKRGRPPKNT